MKTTVPRHEFQEALAAVAAVASGRTTKPILNCVHLSAADKTLELGATDGEVGLRLRVPLITLGQAGEAVVSADRLLGIVRELADVEVVLEVDEKHCTIRGEGSEFRIFVTPPADFPPVPDFDGEADLTLRGNDLRQMIRLTLYAAARESSRYAINGALWEKRGKQLFMVATDGRRLARAGCALRQARSEDFEAIVPTKALSVFERVFAAPKDEAEWLVQIRVTPNQVLLSSGERLLASVLVEGSFPKYQDVIPSGSDKQARLDRLAFYAAVRQAALLTTEDSRAVKLAFNAGELVITSQAPEQGDARIQMPIGYEGEPVSIGFNPAYLNDALKTVTFDEVIFEMQESFRPGVLSGGDKEEFLYVIMPVSLSS